MPSPKAAVRASYAAGVVDEATARCLMTAIEDRNMTSDVYDLKVAELLYPKLAKHAEALGRWYEGVHERAATLDAGL